MNNSPKTGGGHFVPAATPHSEIPFPDELEHLAFVNRILEQALADAETDVGRKDREYMEQKRYMVAYRGEIDPHEMFQNELALRDMDRSGAFLAGVRNQLAKLKKSPYFARIDFTDGSSAQTDRRLSRGVALLHRPLRLPPRKRHADLRLARAHRQHVLRL